MKLIFFVSAFAPENLVSLDGFSIVCATDLFFTGVSSGVWSCCCCTVTNIALGEKQKQPSEHPPINSQEGGNIIGCRDKNSSWRNQLFYPV